MIDKKDMSEEEIKLNYITPAITETWSKSCIRMEFPVTPGRIMLDGKKAKRRLFVVLKRWQAGCRCGSKG